MAFVAPTRRLFGVYEHSEATMVCGEFAVQNSPRSRTDKAKTRNNVLGNTRVMATAWVGEGRSGSYIAVAFYVCGKLFHVRYKVRTCRPNFPDT